MTELSQVNNKMKKSKTAKSASVLFGIIFVLSCLYIIVPENDYGRNSWSENESLVVHNKRPGQLSKLLVGKDGKFDSKLIESQSLTISGMLNGTDIATIRQLIKAGIVTSLDIENADIVAGTDAYYTLNDDKFTTHNNIIGAYMFADCDKLVSIKLPKNVKVIEDYAFKDCKLLRNIQLPTYCDSIKNEAFSNDSSLESINIPPYVRYISENNFSNCYHLKDIKVSNQNKKYKSVNGVLFTKSGRTLVRCPKGIRYNYTVPEGTDTIGEHAFDSSFIHVIKLPQGLKVIGNSAFYGMKYLRKINIPSSVTNIGRNAFYCCYGLRSISIPDQVSKLSSHTFDFCVRLKTIELGASLTEIEPYAFNGCDTLEAFNVSKRNKTFASKEGVLYSKDMKVLYRYPMGLVKCNMADNLKEIKDEAFEGCKIESIELPKGLKKIPYGCFRNCFELHDVIIPSTVDYISLNAFENCVSLSRIIMRNKTHVPHFDITALGRPDIPDSCMWIVPKGLKDAYKNQDWWNNKWKISEE